MRRLASREAAVTGIGRYRMAEDSADRADRPDPPPAPRDYSYGRRATHWIEVATGRITVGSSGAQTSQAQVVAPGSR
jgi:hypothetical protein